MMEQNGKRASGQVKSGEWLVIVESKKGRHSCGKKILFKKVIHLIWDHTLRFTGKRRGETVVVPFCPKCEREPRSD